MTKSELISAVSEKSGLTKKDSEKATSALFEAITDILQSGDKIQIIGFGTFEVKERKERKGRIPKTGEEITIPATKSPVFKAGKYLKDVVAGKVTQEEEE